jgi:hypothetical protein
MYAMLFSTFLLVAGSPPARGALAGLVVERLCGYLNVKRSDPETQAKV